MLPSILRLFTRTPSPRWVPTIKLAERLNFSWLNHEEMRAQLNLWLTGASRYNPFNISFHHIVQQIPDNIRQFGFRAIYSLANVVPLPNATHRIITNFQISRPAFAGGRRFSDWISTHPWEYQYRVGIRIMWEALRYERITWEP